MAGSDDRRAVVAGAGIGGLTAAVALRRQGWDVTVLERAQCARAGRGGPGPRPRTRCTPSTPSASAATCGAFRGPGPGRAAPPRRRLAGPDRPGRARRPVRRSAARGAARRLVGLLAGRLPAGTLRTGVTVTGVDAGDAGRPARVLTSAGELDADLVVAADGIGSRIRAPLFPDHPGPRYSGFTAWRFVAPALPAGAAGRARRDVGEGRGVRHPPAAPDGQVYCYASAPVPPGVRHDDEAAELKRRFGHWHDPIPGLIGAISSDRRAARRRVLDRRAAAGLSPRPGRDPR